MARMVMEVADFCNYLLRNFFVTCCQGWYPARFLAEKRAPTYRAMVDDKVAVETSITARAPVDDVILTIERDRRHG
jgi:hypothetical protein